MNLETYKEGKTEVQRAIKHKINILQRNWRKI